ncbi:MAG: integrase [Sulfurospirillum sp.]
MEKKLTVIETAELLGVSKEAIYNRIRRGSLETVIENGIKYVVLTQEVKKSSRVKKLHSVANDAYIQLLRDEMRDLKERNRALEADKDRLIKEKERLLIESKEKIEQIYKQRDEQLKTILSLATKNILENKTIQNSDIIIDEYNQENDTVDADIDFKESEIKTQKNLESYSDWKDLRDYLKQKGYSKKQKKMIKKKFKMGEINDTPKEI